MGLAGPARPDSAKPCNLNAVYTYIGLDLVRGSVKGAPRLESAPRHGVPNETVEARTFPHAVYQGYKVHCAVAIVSCAVSFLC